MAHISDKWRVSTFSGNGGILHLQDASAMQIAAVLGRLAQVPHPYAQGAQLRISKFQKKLINRVLLYFDSNY